MDPRGDKSAAGFSNYPKLPPIEMEGLEKMQHIMRDSIIISRNFIPEIRNDCA